MQGFLANTCDANLFLNVVIIFIGLILCLVIMDLSNHLNGKEKK